MITNTDDTYGLVAIALHWIVAIVIIGLFALGFWMVELSYYDSWYRQAPHIHKSIGVLLLLTMLFRVAWRAVNQRPKPLPNHRKWEVAGAHLTHILLYLLIFLVLVAGYLISTADGRAIAVFDWFSVPGFGSIFGQQEEWAGNIHRWGAYALISAAFIHAAAAIKHHLFDRDNTLKRMLRTH